MADRQVLMGQLADQGTSLVVASAGAFIFYQNFWIGLGSVSAVIIAWYHLQKQILQIEKANNNHAEEDEHRIMENEILQRGLQDRYLQLEIAFNNMQATVQSRELTAKVKHNSKGKIRNVRLATSSPSADEEILRVNGNSIIYSQVKHPKTRTN